MSWNEFKIEEEKKKQELRRMFVSSVPARDDAEDSEEDCDIFENDGA